MDQEITKKLYDDKEIIELAMIEQFAIHFLGGDVELAKKLAKEDVLDKNQDVE